MSSEALTPKTNLQETNLVGLPRLYVSSRVVAGEYKEVERGSVLGSQFGTEYKDNIIIDAKVLANGGKRILNVVHCAKPDWVNILSTSDRLQGTGEYLFQEQVVLKPTQAEMEADWLAQYQKINEVLSIRRVLIPRRLNVDGTYTDGYPVQQMKSRGSGPLTPAKFRKFVTTKVTAFKRDLDVTNVDELPAVPALAGDEVLIKHTKTNDNQYVAEYTELVIDLVVTPLEGELTDTWGINTTSESLVAEGTATDSGFGVKKGTVTPLGDGTSIKKTENYPSPPQATDIIYTLEEQEQDEIVGAIFDIEKQLVNAATAKSLAATKRAADWFTEIKSLDKWHSILISAKIDASSLVTQIWDESANLRLPSRLEEVGVIWDNVARFFSGNAGAGDEQRIIDNDISWTVSAEVSVTGSVSARHYTKVKAGITGAGNVKVTRTFHFGPPTGSFSEYSSRSVYGYITIRGAQAQSQARTSQRGIGDLLVTSTNNGRYFYDNKMSIHRFGPVEYASGLSLTELGDNPTVDITANSSGGGTPDGGLYPTAEANVNIQGVATLEMPTSSTPLNPGDTFILKVDVRPWRYGYWIKEVYEATVPTPNS